jgi:hypothetical protein
VRSLQLIIGAYLSQMNPVNTLSFSVLKTYFNIFSSAPDFPSGLILPGLRTKNNALSPFFPRVLQVQQFT